MKRGLIISLYSSGRERVQQALELSIQQDLVEFDLLRLDPVATISELAEGYAKGYDYALKNGYEFVGHIDDDDLVVPGCFTFLMKLLDKKPKAAGFAGLQYPIRSEVPDLSIQESAQLLFNQHHNRFHGVAVYRTKELYPTIKEWRQYSNPMGDQHRALARMLMADGKTLGLTNSITCFYRLREQDGNYYS
jgi:hypothetical protein